MYQRILVPTDGSDVTAKAVQTAIDLAKSSGGQLVTISVKEPFPYSAISEMQPVPPQEFYDAQERIASARVKAVQDAAAAAGIACQAHTVEALHAWEAIIDHAKQQRCDLIDARWISHVDVRDLMIGNGERLAGAGVERIGAQLVADREQVMLAQHAVEVYRLRYRHQPVF